MGGEKFNQEKRWTSKQIKQSKEKVAMPENVGRGTVKGTVDVTWKIRFLELS